VEIHEVLAAIGGLGFASVFQGVGLLVVKATVGAVREAGHKGQLLRTVPGAVGALLFGAVFAGMPFAMVLDFGGWPAFAAQAVVCVYLALALWLPAPAATPAPAPPPDPAPVPRVPFWRRGVSAAPALLLAGAFGLALAGRPLPGAGAAGLCHLVGVEFLVIHSFPFLSLITLPRVTTRRWRIFQWYLFVTWFLLYVAFAVKDDGAAGLAAFASGTLATYLGFLLRRTGQRAIVVLFKRWLAGFALFLVCAVVAGSQGWRVSPTTLWHGAAYFALLGGVELTGLYERPWRAGLKSVGERLARKWARRQLKKAVQPEREPETVGAREA